MKIDRSNNNSISANDHSIDEVEVRFVDGPVGLKLCWYKVNDTQELLQVEDFPDMPNGKVSNTSPISSYICLYMYVLLYMNVLCYRRA